MREIPRSESDRIRDRDPGARPNSISNEHKANSARTRVVSPGMCEFFFSSLVTVVALHYTL